MKLWIFPELRLEYAPLQEQLEMPDADVCVFSERPALRPKEWREAAGPRRNYRVCFS